MKVVAQGEPFAVQSQKAENGQVMKCNSVAGVGRQVRGHVRGSHAGAAGLVQILCGRAGVYRPPLPDARVQRADVSGHPGGGTYQNEELRMKNFLNEE